MMIRGIRGKQTEKIISLSLLIDSVLNSLFNPPKVENNGELIKLRDRFTKLKKNEKRKTN